ncbi:MAG: HEPN domain-containing protein [Dongiaceae bacterium]
MSEERRISAFLAVADADIEAARALARIANRNAAYLCQQAAEKLIKAVLQDRGIDFGTEHRLDVLEKLPGNDPWRLKPLESLTPFATTYRYPTPGGRIPAPPDLSVLETQIVLIDGLPKTARAELSPRKSGES